MAQYFERMLDGRELVAPLFPGSRHFDDKSAADFAESRPPARAPRWAIGWVAEGEISRPTAMST